MSNPSDEDWKRMAKLVDTFFNRADAEPFREPVAFKELGLIDYPQIIKEPMDLGTIRQRLKKGGHYKTLYQVAEDVRKVWTNCMTYNADGSDFFKLAQSLQRKWEDKYTKLLQDCQGLAGAAVAPGTASNLAATPKASLTDKRTFAKSLYQISKEDLGKILIELESKCPAALTKNASEDEIELNVDNIPAALLQELMTFVQTAKAHNASNNSKKKTPAAAPAAAGGSGAGSAAVSTAGSTAAAGGGNKKAKLK